MLVKKGLYWFMFLKELICFIIEIIFIFLNNYNFMF